MPSMVLRQNTTSVECRVVGQACLMGDIPQRVVCLESLADQVEALKAGALPVGSVQFVAEAMRLAGIKKPDLSTYPADLAPFLGRAVRVTPLAQVQGTCFIKPVETKLFTGFVLDEKRRDSEYSEHDLEQLKIVRGLRPETMVWVSSPVAFLSEARYYMLKSRLIGFARYDPDGRDDAGMPDLDVVEQAANTLDTSRDAPVAYALDMGVLSDGSTVLVEVNDAWATGYYGRDMSPKAYLQWLWARWSQLLESRVT